MKKIEDYIKKNADKTLHFAVSAVLVPILTHWFSKTGIGLVDALFLAAISTMAIGLGKELYDTLIDVEDLKSDLLGVIIGTFILTPLLVL